MAGAHGDGGLMVIWLTGLSGAGKTALSDALIAAAKPNLPTLVRLDGDVIRAIFGADLGYSEPERVVQIKRIQALAKELDQQGFVVLVAALYSHPDLLAWNRANFSDYFEIYLDTSLEEVQRRDSKGLYRRARAGAQRDVVGIDIPWHAPRNADLALDGAADTPAALARRVIESVPVLAGAMGLQQKRRVG
jgi:cytidine diphosphoramidate kinase